MLSSIFQDRVIIRMTNQKRSRSPNSAASCSGAAPPSPWKSQRTVKKRYWHVGSSPHRDPDRVTPALNWHGPWRQIGPTFEFHVQRLYEAFLGAHAISYVTPFEGFCGSRFFLVEGALYYERGTKFSEPNALDQHSSLVTVVPNSGDGTVIMMSGNDGAYCAAGTAKIDGCASSRRIGDGHVHSSRRRA